MKNSLLLLAMAAAPAWAGTTSKEVLPPPPVEPSLLQWFAGASAGYLIDGETDMFHAHLGVDLPQKWGGWTPSVFLEVGIAEVDETTSIVDPTFLAAVVRTDLDMDFEFIPVTLNLKLERDLGHGFSTYFGAGVGVAFTDLSARADFAAGPGLRYSDSDTVFYAQLFAGVGYQVNPQFEVYGGLRYLILDEPDAPAPVNSVVLEDDVLVELGVRYNF